MWQVYYSISVIIIIIIIIIIIKFLQTVIPNYWSGYVFLTEVKVTLWLTVSQYVLVSSTLVGLATWYYFLSDCCCLKFAVFYLWGALSEERTSL
jgi:hypothetical protein